MQDVKIEIPAPKTEPEISNVSGCALATAGTCSAAFFSGWVSGVSAASGATGAAILKASGHAAYSVKQAAAAGATGGAVLAIPTAIVLLCCSSMFGNKENEKDKKEKSPVGQWALSAGLAALSGVLGYAMLYTGEYHSDMSVGQFAAATAVGSAVLSGGSAMLSALCGSSPKM